MFQDKTYTLIIDLFSHFLVVRQLCGESTELVLDALKAVFSNFGIPESIISDNAHLPIPSNIRLLSNGTMNVQNMNIPQSTFELKEIDLNNSAVECESLGTSPNIHTQT